MIWKILLILLLTGVLNLDIYSEQDAMGDRTYYDVRLEHNEVHLIADTIFYWPPDTNCTTEKHIENPRPIHIELFNQHGGYDRRLYIRTEDRCDWLIVELLVRIPPYCFSKECRI